MIALGYLEVHLLRTGRFRLDGGAMFGVVPRALWSRVAPPDDRNRIRLGLNCLYFRAAGKHVVVDTGIGPKWDAKGADLYAVEDDPGVVGALAPLGVKPDQIDMVVNTHLHFDHAGGNTLRAADGTLAPTFPNARYHVHGGNLREEALQPNEMRRASYLPENFQPILDRGGFEELSGKYGSIIEGWLSYVVTGGHQKWHCMILVADGRGGPKLAFPADLIPTAAHVNPPWIMAYDHFPVETLEVKKKVLAQAAEEGWILVLEHEPDHPVGKVRRDGPKFRWEPLEERTS